MAAKRTQLSIVIKAIDEATAPIRKLNAKIQKFSANVTKVGKKITTSLTVPIVGLGVASVKAFSEFETGMASVSTLIDTTNESIEDMGQTVLDIGGRVPVKMKDLTTSLFNVRSAGISAADQFVVLEQSARLGVAGLGTTEQAVDLATSSINAFGLEGEKALEVYDQVFTATKFGKTTIAELSQGFGAVAGQVAATGTELDEYLSAVSALTTTGLPAAQAHTQLRATIAGLTRDTKKTRKVFRGLGAKDFKDLIAKTGGLVPALEAVSGKLKGNEARILKTVGSTEALNAILSLTGQQNKVFKDTLVEMRNESVLVDEAFEKQNKTMGARWQRTKNILFATGVTIGEVLAPAIAAVASKIQTAAKWFKGLDKETRATIVRIAAVAAVVGPTVVVMGKLVAAISAISTAVGVATKVIKILGVVMKANPAILIATAIGAAALLIITNWKPIAAFFTEMWGQIKRGFASFWNLIQPVFEFTPLGVIVDNWGPISDFFAELWRDVVAAFEVAWRIIKGIVDKLAGAVDAIRSAVATIQEETKGTLVAAFTVAKKATETPEQRQQREVAEARATATAQSLGNVARTFITERQSARVEVNFANAPRGTRVQQTGGDTDVDLTTGFQAVLP